VVFLYIINAIGIRTRIPLDTEIICAGRGCSVEIRYVAVTRLKPINGQARKYKRIPGIASA